MVAMGRDLFFALLPYLGGKRRLLPLIFGLLADVLPRRQWAGASFLDPMCGGGSVALYAKAQGFAVTASDASRIGEVVARALIANSSTRLAQHHFHSLLTHPLVQEGPAQRFVPQVFTAAQATWLDTALAAAAAWSDPVRSLLELVIVRTALRLQPMSTLDATDAHRISAQEFDEISPRRLAHYLRADRALTLPALIKLTADINAGVIGGRGTASCGDARKVIPACSADVIYLDAPYPGTTGYHDPYAPLRTLLGDDLSDDVPTLDELLEVADHIPLAVISYGGRGVTLDGLVQTVSAHRRVLRAVAVPYPHLKSLARKEHADANREFIVIAAR